MKRIICMLTLLFSSLLVNAQEEKQKIGLTASLQATQMDIMVPVWLGKNFIVAPTLNFTTVENGGTTYGFGLVPRLFLNHNQLRPYLSARIVALLTSAASNNQFEEDSTLDFLTGLAFGGEYFIDPQFSIGVEAQTNLTISDENSGRFGNPGGTNINTGMAVLVNVYF